MAKYICDGHEYSIVETGTIDNDSYRILNNYGSHVASFGRDVPDEYWHVTLPNGDSIAQMHEHSINDYALDQWAIQAYVAWAMDNDTVEGHQ